MSTRIAVLEMTADDRTATGERGRAIVRFLKQHGYEVDVLAPSPNRLEAFARSRFSLAARVKRRLLRRRYLRHLWDFVADDMEKRLAAGGYSAAIARHQATGYVFTRPLNLVRIFDLANVAFLELYHGWGADLLEVEQVYEKEMALYQVADAILAPHEILAGFFRRHVYDDPKIVTVRLGCDLPDRTARFSAQPRIVYAGSYTYIQDPYLLALLSATSPYPIDCYGHREPNWPFLPSRLNYCGYRQTLDFLSEYQVGLITLSADRLRRHSPATKFACYFAAGLPVLFPDWMAEGHTYPAAVPYTESSFAERAASLLRDRARWEELSARARDLARALTWDRVLPPLIGLLPPAR